MINDNAGEQSKRNLPQELWKDSAPVAQFLLVTLPILEALKENLLCCPAGAHHRAALVEVPDVLKASGRPFHQVFKTDQLLLLRGWVCSSSTGFASKGIEIITGIDVHIQQKVDGSLHSLALLTTARGLALLHPSVLARVAKESWLTLTSVFSPLDVSTSGIVEANARLSEVPDACIGEILGSFHKDILFYGFPARGCVTATIEHLQRRLIWV